MENDQGFERIDLYDHNRKLQRELEQLKTEERILPTNRETIARFIRAARIGHTIKRGPRRRLSANRCRKLLVTLRRFAYETRAPLEQVSPDQMERFILGLEDGTVTKLVQVGQSMKYSPSTVLDFKKILRKFYRWLLMDEPHKVDELTGWFDTRDYAPELKTFTIEDARRMAATAPHPPQGSALVLFLFDAGPRATEAMNVRLGDLTLRTEAMGERVLYARIRVSKTKARTISLPIATEQLLFWIERHPRGGVFGPDGAIRAADPSSTLFTWQYNTCRNMLSEMGKRELRERLYFHRFRHASATWYASRLTEYQMCARYGWVMGSRAVRRYVDQAGVLSRGVSERILSELRDDQSLGPLPIQQTGSQAPAELLGLLRRDPMALERLRKLLNGEGE